MTAAQARRLSKEERKLRIRTLLEWIEAYLDQLQRLNDGEKDPTIDLDLPRMLLEVRKIADSKRRRGLEKKP